LDRTKESEAPLFPGYLFCRFDPQERGLIATTPGVIKVLGDSWRPVPIDPIEIEALQRIVTSPHTFEKCVFLRTGQRVFVRCGPLRGLTGLLASVNDQHQLVVSVTLMQRSVAVQIPVEWTSPVNNPQDHQDHQDDELTH